MRKSAVNKKIAVIATPLLEPYVNDVFGASCLDSSQEAPFAQETLLHATQIGFDYHVFVYRCFEDIRDIASRLTQDYDGILVSGSFPAHMLKLYAPTETRPVRFFNTDDAAFYKLLLSLLQEQPNLNFERIYADITEIFGISLMSFLENEDTLPDISLLSPETFTQQRMEQLEHEVFEKHLHLWNEGAIDVSISRFSSIVPYLQQAGVRCFFPYPSKRYMYEICDALVQDINLRRLQAQNPGVVIIRYQGNSHTASNVAHDVSTRLRDVVGRFASSTLPDCIISEHNYGLEIITSRKVLESWTYHFSQDRLFCYLAKYLQQEALCIGYGLGHTVTQARLNALDACREAELKEASGYVVSEQEELRGPLSADEAVVGAIELSEQLFSEPLRASSLSPVTVHKIFAALRMTDSGEITSRELALRLGITRRSANRFLSTLLAEGHLTLARKTRTSSLGRPENVYAAA